MSELILSELTLTPEQEKWLKEWLFKWGAWVRTGRLDKRQVNIIARLMESVTPSDPQDPICTDDEGLLISHVINEFFKMTDNEMQFIVFGYYVNKMKQRKLSSELLKVRKIEEMKPCNGKSDYRKVSLSTIRRRVKERLGLANKILHKMLLTAFILQKSAVKNRKNIKLCY